MDLSWNRAHLRKQKYTKAIRNEVLTHNAQLKTYRFMHIVLFIIFNVIRRDRLDKNPSVMNYVIAVMLSRPRFLSTALLLGRSVTARMK